MDITALFQKMIVLFFTIGVGYGAVKLRLVDQSFNRHLSRLILYLLQALLILSSVLNTEHLLTNREVLSLTGIATACFVFLILAALLIPKLLRVKGRNGGLYQFMFIFSNIGFIGYPVVQSLFGTDAMFYVSIFILLFQLVVFTYGVFLISGDRKHIRISLQIFKKPVIVASLLAYVIYLSGIRVPQLAADCVRYVGELTTPLSMLVIGCSLAAVPMRTVFRNGRMYALLAVKMVVVPLLAFAALSPLLDNRLLLGITVVMLAMPCATNATMLSVEYGNNEQLASSGIFLSTLLSLVTIPAIMWLLFGRG